jgi:hypothetical protein
LIRDYGLSFYPTSTGALILCADGSSGCTTSVKSQWALPNTPIAIVTGGKLLWFGFASLDADAPNMPKLATCSGSLGVHTHHSLSNIPVVRLENSSVHV